MPCFHPLQAYYCDSPKGRVIEFNKNFAMLYNGVSDATIEDYALKLPCGQCHGCRMKRAQEWAIRCMHEAQMYGDRNCFITLTYDEDHLPAGGTLVKSDFQKFMKRLRKKFGEGIRYYHCGEYGERFLRPHYHALLFNFDFDDKVFYKTTGSGSRLFVSDDLKRLWPDGWSTVGSVSFESAAYCARYCVKKMNGRLADGYYKGRQPEYNTMSRRPGVGKVWYDKYKSDVFPSDQVIYEGRSLPPPRYYSGLYEIECPDDFKLIKAARQELQLDLELDSTPERLADREKCALASFSKLKRSYEQGESQ